MTERNRPTAQETSPFRWMTAMHDPSFWTTFGTVARAAEPVARSTTRAQLEMSSLIGTRAKAWAEIPSTLSRCRTPMDLFQAQVAFWQEAGRDYSEASQRLAATWSAVISGGSQAASEAVEPRDYITFPEPSGEAEERRHPGESRRAA